MKKVSVQTHKINNEIVVKTDKIRVLIQDENDLFLSLKQAKELAIDMDVDLVQVSESPVICKLMDYKKFIFDQRKNTKTQKRTITKEIRFSSSISEHDFNFKLKSAIEFLKKKDKVKAYIHFKGREITHKELGEIVLLKLAQSIEDVGKVEFLPKLEGRRMYILIAPK